MIRRVGTTTLVLTVSSLALLLPGIVRIKLAAIEFGTTGVGVFGQLSQLQGTAVVFGAAGFATAARVMMAKASDRDKRSLSAALFWIPVAISIVIVIGAIVAGGPIAQWWIGDSSDAPLISAVLLGVPTAVMVQVAVAIAQANAETLTILASALVGTTLACGTTAVLMTAGTPERGAISFAVAPAIQAMATIAFLRSVRHSVFSVPRVGRVALSSALAITWASLLLGGSAMVADAVSRGYAVRHLGVDTLSGYQPVAFFVVQGMSIVLSALAASSMVEFSNAHGLREVSRDLDATLGFVIPAIGAMTAGIALLAHPMTRLFFSDGVAKNAEASLDIALGGEPLRATAWVLGATLLPLGRRRPWLLLGLCTVLVQSIASIGVLRVTGDIESLAIGFVVGSWTACGINLAYLHVSGVRVSPRLILCVGLLGGAVTMSAFLPLGVGHVVAAAAAMTWLAVLASKMRKGRISGG